MTKSITIANLITLPGILFAAPLAQPNPVDALSAVIAVGGIGMGVLFIVAFIVSRLPNTQSANDAVSKLATALSKDAESRSAQTELGRDELDQRKKEIEVLSQAQSRLQTAVDSSNSKWIELSEKYLKLMDDGIRTTTALRNSVNDGNTDHETRASAFRTDTISRLDRLAETVGELSKEVMGADNKPSIKSILTTISEEITGLRADLNRIPEPPAAAEPPAPSVIENMNVSATNVTLKQSEKGNENETPNPDPTPNPATPSAHASSPGPDAAAGADPRADAGDGAQ